MLGSEGLEAGRTVGVIMTMPRQRVPSGAPPLLTTPEARSGHSPVEVRGTAAVFLALAAGAAVLVLGSAAVYLRPAGSSLAAWWPSAAVAVVAVAFVEARKRWLVAVCVGLGGMAANLAADRPLVTLVGFAVANGLVPLIWIFVMTRAGRRARLLTAEDFGRFVLATLTATALSGLVSATGIALGMGGDLLTAWGAFVAAQSASILILAPFALPLPAPIRRPATVELVCQVLALVLSVLVLFLPQRMLPLGVLPLPFLVWGAVRLPARWVSGELLVAGVLTSILTTLGRGPYAHVVREGFQPELIGLLLEVALVVYALVSLPLTLLVHQQAAALASARDSYELADSILTGATGTAIIGWGPDGTIIFFNAGAEDMLGYSAEEVVGRCTPEEFHDRTEIEQRARLMGVRPGVPVLTALVDAGAPSERRDWTMVRRDGTRLTVAMRVTARVSESGEHLGYLGVGDDVTERRRTETTLRVALDRERQALDRMEQLDQAKTTFVSTVSHELRTPMTSVLGYTDMVLSGTAGPVNQEQRGMLEAARRNGRRLLRLIEDLLTVSLIENGSFTLDMDSVDLRSAAQGAIEAVRPLFVDRRLAFDVRLGEQELPVAGDLDHLERVVLNLLANAVKFTPDGGRVGITLGARGAEAFLEVTDTGIGIPAEEQPQLFQRFFRSTTAQELEVPGTGLGLSIVRTIVSSHGGEISVRSKPGEGTTFRVELPLRQPAEL